MAIYPIRISLDNSFYCKITWGLLLLEYHATIHLKHHVRIDPIAISCDEKSYSNITWRLILLQYHVTMNFIAISRVYQCLCFTLITQWICCIRNSLLRFCISSVKSSLPHLIKAPFNVETCKDIEVWNIIKTVDKVTNGIFVFKKCNGR